MTCWSYFPVIFLNTFPLSKDAKLSSVCAVPVDDWFPLAKDAGTKVPQCAWPNLEGGATVEKTASVKSERFHHTYTAVPLLSHLPQHTWVVTEKSFEADYENTSFLFFFSLSFCTLFFVRVSQSKRWNEKTMGERARERLLCTFSSRPHPPPPPTMVFSFDLCLAFALFVSYFTNHKRRTYQQNRLARGYLFW